MSKDTDVDELKKFFIDLPYYGVSPEIMQQHFTTLQNLIAENEKLKLGISDIIAKLEKSEKPFYEACSKLRELVK